MGERPNKTIESPKVVAAKERIREWKKGGYTYGRIINGGLVVMKVSVDGRCFHLNKDDPEVVEMVVEEIARKKAEEAK